LTLTLTGLFGYSSSSESSLTLEYSDTDCFDLDDFVTDFFDYLLEGLSRF